MLLIPAILEGYRSLKDKTFHVAFGTNELTPEQIGELHGALQNFGYLAFKSEPFLKDEVDLIDGLEVDYEDLSKRPSQRMRAVLYRLWEKDNMAYSDFNLYYKFRMEKIINHLKKQLD